jgi:hypothetical protein
LTGLRYDENKYKIRDRLEVIIVNEKNRNIDKRRDRDKNIRRIKDKLNGRIKNRIRHIFKI